MNQLKSIYNSPLKDSHSHPIHTCFPIIDSKDSKRNLDQCIFQAQKFCDPIVIRYLRGQCLGPFKVRVVNYIGYDK